MGNFANPLLRGDSLLDLSHSNLFSPQTKEAFIIKEILTHSLNQHHEHLLHLTKFKHYQCQNVLKLVDSHTMQSSNLCSLTIYLYAVFEKPKFTFRSYLE